MDDPKKVVGGDSEEDGPAGSLNMYADLSMAIAATINALRQAFQLDDPKKAVGGDSEEDGPAGSLNMPCEMCGEREADVTLKEYLCGQCYDKYAKG